MDVVLVDDCLHREGFVVLREVHHLAEFVLGIECKGVDHGLICDPEQLAVLGVGGVVSEDTYPLDDEGAHLHVEAPRTPIPFEGGVLPGGLGDSDLARNGGNDLERAEFGGDDFLVADPDGGPDDSCAVVGDTALEDERFHLQLEWPLGGESVYLVDGGVVTGRFDPNRGRGVEHDEGAPTLDADGLVAVVGRDDRSGERNPLVSENGEVIGVGLDHAGDHPNSHDEPNDEDGHQQYLEQVFDETGAAYSVAGCVAPSPAEDLEIWIGSSAGHGSTTSFGPVRGEIRPRSCPV